MSDSLRDQLLKQGLVDEQSVKKTRSNKRKKRRRGETDAEQAAASEAAAQREADRRARDRTLNARQQEERKRQEEEQAARQMVIDREVAHDGDERFQFSHNGRIRPIRVSAAQRGDLAAGRLAIARTRGRYRLVPGNIVEFVQARAPFLIAWTAADSGGGDDQDDAYADYPVPDDLMW
ncbi:DUF2058 family protein [Spiribacter vilamensis]|uniref:DUF2058 domain-containing protein n=1 Tax=Spiribacter vilamensis TaxID=531306 RepID=A0A4Q8D163_9GAMM|nr:DUF2058 family protein [Spiribacter vilamensis]RZU99034.1 hypothetical protein EV698_1310 [Spiribacter vilamensis]TVO61964.1 DUF2058 family protein [Spiribacter vilamensis]